MSIRLWLQFFEQLIGRAFLLFLVMLLALVMLPTGFYDKFGDTGVVVLSLTSLAISYASLLTLSKRHWRQRSWLFLRIAETIAGRVMWLFFLIVILTTFVCIIFTDQNPLSKTSDASAFLLWSLFLAFTISVIYLLVDKAPRSLPEFKNNGPRIKTGASLAVIAYLVAPFYDAIATEVGMRSWGKNVINAIFGGG